MSEKLVFRSSGGGGGDRYCHGEYLEKRQLFLRSYQFSRKQSFRVKVTRSVRRVKSFRATFKLLHQQKSLKNIFSLFFYLPDNNNNNKLKMLRILGKYRSRSSCHYQKLSHHKEKVTLRHNSGKKLEGRSKGFRLNRPRRLVLKALVLPRRIFSIYARITDKMNIEGFYPNLVLSSHWGFPVVSEKKLIF
ncbi:hypothetical protein Bca4012_014872 [Brassica carinata]